MNLILYLVLITYVHMLVYMSNILIFLDTSLSICLVNINFHVHCVCLTVAIIPCKQFSYTA